VVERLENGEQRRQGHGTVDTSPDADREARRERIERALPPLSADREFVNRMSLYQSRRTTVPGGVCMTAQA
jgi:hypothetical protein